MRTILLVGCSGRKKDVPACRAADLYIGDLFLLQRGFACVAVGAVDWFILSALHGLIEPGRCIAPYNHTLGSTATRTAWSEATCHSLIEKFGHESHIRFIVFAGEDYRQWIPQLAHLRPEWQFVVPLAGMGIGQQRAAMARMIQAINVARHDIETTFDIYAQFEIGLAAAVLPPETEPADGRCR